MFKPRYFKRLALSILFGVVCIGGVQADSIPVAHWTLDDGQSDLTATTVADTTLNGNDGVFSTETGFTAPTWDAGVIGGALSFNGSTNRVDMSDTDDLDITGAVSMAFWMCRKGDSSGDYGSVVGKNFSGGSTHDAYCVSSYNANSLLRFSITSNNSSVNLDSATSLVNDQWYHVAVVFDPSARMSIYLDGELDATLTSGVPAAIDSEDTLFSLGNLAYGSSVKSYCFNGLLDEVQVYDEVLNVDDIQTLANVPEPSVMALLFCGFLVGLPFLRRR